MGEQIDAAACFAIGGAFAVHTRGDGAARVVVGRDMRPDGAELAGAFCEGVVAAGVDVVDIGLCATEMVYFASGTMDAPGAMFTASHNPAGYNGIKLCGPGASPVGAGTGLEEIKARAIEGQPRAAAPGNSVRRDLLDSYVEHVLSFVSVPALRPLRLAVDTANGMGGLVAPAVLEALPFEVDYLHPEPRRHVPQPPGGPPQAREPARSAGPGCEPDARTRVSPSTATPTGCSWWTRHPVRCRAHSPRRSSASAMLERHPGSAVVHNLICSRALPEIVSERGGRAVRARVGHSFMKMAMADSSAVFGGEHSGHYYFRHNYGADSAMIAVVVALEALSLHGGRLSELAAPLERYAASGEINTEVPDAAAVLERVAAAFEGCRQDRLDGLSVDCGDWWFNLRPSNTEPLLRLNLEAAGTGDVKARVAEVSALIVP